MNYKKAVKYIDSFINYEKIPYYDYKTSLKFNRMERFLSLLGNPEKNLKTIHITGTKGKGSTASIVSSILKEAGFKTGLYTSPHLISFRERIKINGDEIPEDDITSILNEIKPAVEKLKKTEKVSFFEILTAISFIYFKREKVDFTVLEVGMGGRLDATNAVDDSISAITPISLEHTQKLGSTLSEIAYEKAGIIKNNSLCLTSPQEPEAMDIIEEICRRKDTRLLRIQKDIFLEEKDFNDKEQEFNVWGRFGEYRNLRFKLLGQHQLMNAALAVGISESLRRYGVIINEPTLRKGLLAVDWPGRLEVVSREPFIILDGAQNKASSQALVSAIKRHFKYKKIILIFAISQDKDIEGTSGVLGEFADEIIITKVKNTRAAHPKRLKKYFNKNPITVTGNSKSALKLAGRKAERDDIILATGSLFLVGEIKEILRNAKKH